MISKKYFIILILISVFLIAGSVVYAGISGYGVEISQKSILKIKNNLLNYREIADDNFASSITGNNRDNSNNHRKGSGSSGSSSGISGLASLVSVQNFENPGIFLFQGFVGEDFEFFIEPANIDNETEQFGLEYRAEFFDAENNLLKVFNFSAEEIEYSDYKMFYFFAEIPLETKRIVFYDNQEVLEEFVISENSPVVSDVEISELEENEGSEFLVTWEAEDADEEELIFSVLINNGDESYIVGDLIKGNAFVLNTNFISTGNYKIIVRAFDGFNFGYGESDFFSIGEKKPFLQIFGISNNSEILLNQEIYAIASGFDLEDGFLNSFSWKLDGEEIGSENSIILSGLPLGEYELTLEAEDSDGNTGTENIKFFVVESLNTWCNNADINRDGVIDANDYDVIDKIWLFYRNATCSFDNNWCNYADITRDGKVDANDYDRIDKTYLFADDSGRCTRLF